MIFTKYVNVYFFLIIAIIIGAVAAIIAVHPAPLDVAQAPAQEVVQKPPVISRMKDIPRTSTKILDERVTDREVNDQVKTILKKTSSTSRDNKKQTILEIQSILAQKGFYHGAIDGKMGPVTIGAIKNFQKSRKLKVDGVVGPKTWYELSKNNN